MQQELKIGLGKVELSAIVAIPEKAIGVVVFAHGSGSSRLSPRNQFVAKFLNQQQIGTVLVDLLTLSEERIDDQTAQLRFDISLLADRLVGVIDWAIKQHQTRIALFGSSTGAAAALIAAAKKGTAISSVVSRGGRPDLAKLYLEKVKSPTLLIVGEYDEEVIQLNQEAFAHLKCPKKMEIVPGATHLFEESGCLEKVARLAAQWFVDNF